MLRVTIKISKGKKMRLSAKICSALFLSLFITACSGSDESAILELKAAMEACEAEDEATLEATGNQMTCVVDTGNNFFAEQCGVEDAFTNIFQAAMKKAFASAGNDATDSELTADEVRDLMGDCVSDLWLKMEEMSALQ